MVDNCVKLDMVAVSPVLHLTAGVEETSFALAVLGDCLDVCTGALAGRTGRLLPAQRSPESEGDYLRLPVHRSLIHSALRAVLHLSWSFPPSLWFKQILTYCGCLGKLQRLDQLSSAISVGLKDASARSGTNTPLHKKTVL